MAGRGEIQETEDWDKEEPVGQNYFMTVEEAQLLDQYHISLNGEQTVQKIVLRAELSKKLKKVQEETKIRSANCNIWGEPKENN